MKELGKTSAIPRLGILESITPFAFRISGTCLVPISSFFSSVCCSISPLFSWSSLSAFFSPSVLSCGTKVECHPPILWIIGLFVPLQLGMLPFQDDNPEPRWNCRNRQQDVKGQHKARRGWNPRSIRSHGFHRKYPIDLRGLGHFLRNPPNMEHQNTWKHIHQIMGELQH